MRSIRTSSVSMFFDVPGLDPDWFDTRRGETLIVEVSDGQNNYLVSVNPSSLRRR